MIANKLPAVLQQPHGNSLSLERALRQAISLMMNHCDAAGDASIEDAINASIDDLQTMLASIER